MARNHARIFTSIWNDPEFLALSSRAQRVYLMLLSQQNLSHAGLLPLTVTRWANKAEDTSEADITAALDELDATRFIVIDTQTQELLIRTLIRGDQVYKQINVLKAAAKDARAIASVRLQRAVAEEVARMVRMDGVPITSIGELEALALDLPNPSLSLSEPLANLSLDLDSITPPEPLAKGSQRPEGKGMVTLGDTGSPTPSPSTFPLPGHAAEAAPTDDPTGSLLTEHIAAYATAPPPSAVIQVRTAIMSLVAQGTDADLIRRGLSRMRAKQLGPALLPSLCAEAIPVIDTRDPAPSRNGQILDAAMQRAQAAEAGITRKALGS